MNPGINSATHQFKIFDARLKTPFSLIAGGPSNSGKTTFVNNLLLNQDRLIDHPFDYIYWFYGQVPPKNELFLKLTNLQAVKGIPDSFDNFIHEGQKGAIVLDDLMEQCTNNSLITDFFTKKSHHQDVSVIFITQNLFHKGKERITFMKNATYLVIFNAPLDSSEAFALARRIMPRKPKIFMDIYAHAVEKPHGYLFIDGHQETPKEAIYRTNIFDNVQKVLIPLKQ